MALIPVDTFVFQNLQEPIHSNDNDEINYLKAELAKYKLKYDVLVNIKYDRQYHINMAKYNKIRGEYVYFIILHRIEPRVKIGFTSSLHRRFRTIDIGNSDQSEIIAFIKTPDMKTLEKEFHTALKEYRVKGEWFELTEEDVISMLHNYRETGQIALQ